jgi:hypothetical protein
MASGVDRARDHRRQHDRPGRGAVHRMVVAMTRAATNVLWHGLFEFRAGIEQHRIVRVGAPWGCQVERLVDGEWRHDVVSSDTEARVIKYAFLCMVDGVKS